MIIIFTSKDSSSDIYLSGLLLCFSWLSFNSLWNLIIREKRHFLRLIHFPFSTVPRTKTSKEREIISPFQPGVSLFSSYPGCSIWIPWVVTWFNVLIRPSSQNRDKANHVSEWMLQRKAKKKSTDIESLIYVIIIIAVVVFVWFIFIGSLFGNDTEESRKEGPSSVWLAGESIKFIYRQSNQELP